MGRGSGIGTRGSALNKEVSVEGVLEPLFVGVGVEDAKKGEDENGEAGLLVREVRKPRGRVFERDGDEVLLEDRDGELQLSIGNADRDGGGKKDSWEAGTRRISELGGFGGGNVGGAFAVSGESQVASGASPSSPAGVGGMSRLSCADLSSGM